MSDYWNDARIARLRELWDLGLSASKIAADLGSGLTRNAVIGKSHRLKLSPRKSPFDRSEDTSGTEMSVDRASAEYGSVDKPNVVRFESVRIEREAAVSDARPPAQPAKTVSPAPSPAERQIGGDNQVVAAILRLRETTCRWPFGDPKSGSFRFCGDRAPSGAPYCAEHAGIAYHQAASRSARKPASAVTTSSTHMAGASKLAIAS